MTKDRRRHFFGPIEKERHFFGRFGLEPFGSSDIKDYHEWFPRKEGRITGEWTPDYLYTRGCLRLLPTLHQTPSCC